MMKEVEVSSLVNCSQCCSFIIWSWSFLRFRFNHSFAWSISSKWIFHICSLSILSNSSQTSTSRSRWVWRLFKSSRKTFESCLTQCCSCSTFLISQKIETFRDSSSVWEWGKNWWCFLLQAYQDWIKLVSVSSSDLTQSLFSFINISLFNIIFLSTSHSTRVTNTFSSSLAQSLNIT